MFEERWIDKFNDIVTDWFTCTGSLVVLVTGISR